jgi:hypothetical protein
MVCAPLADIDPLGVTARQRQNLVRDQPVVDQDVGALQQPVRLEGEKIGIARSSADEMHHAGRRRLAAETVQQPDQFAARPDLVAGKRQLADPALEYAIPEAAPRARHDEGAAHLLAEDVGEASQPTQRRRQAAFDLGANTGGQHRCGPPRRDGDRDRRAIDDRGHDEARQPGPVDDVDRNAAPLGSGGHPRLH